MRFKEFYLKEASQEYNIAKVLAKNIIRTLRNMAYRDLSRYEKYKNPYSNTYQIPMTEFIKDVKVPKGRIIYQLMNGYVFLENGYLDNGGKTPYLWVYNGDKKVKAGGYFTPARHELGIHLPFIDAEGSSLFKSYFPEFESLIIHELTHFIQNSKERFSTGTSHLSQQAWFNNKNEQEAYLHELYNDIQKYVKDTLRDIKMYRSNESKAPDYEKYVNFSNSLYKMFEDVESFKKSIRMLKQIIFLDNQKNKNKFEYLSTEHKDIYDKFLEDSFEELKKEFKNVLPTKKLTYGGGK